MVALLRHLQVASSRGDRHDRRRSHSSDPGVSRHGAAPATGAEDADAALRSPGFHPSAAMVRHAGLHGPAGVDGARHLVARSRDVRPRGGSGSSLLAAARVHTLHRVPHATDQRVGGGVVRLLDLRPARLLSLRTLRSPHAHPDRGSRSRVDSPVRFRMGAPCSICRPCPTGAACSAVSSTTHGDA